MQPSTTARLGVSITYSADFLPAAQEVVEYEKLGVDVVSVAEAYSFDAVSRLGYLAAVTDRITLVSGILPIYSRTPALIAMTAAGLDSMSSGRFELGLGSSGAQVIEGFHGVKFDAPLGRTREIIEICREVWKREPLNHQGKYYSAPLPGGLGKPLKLTNHLVRDSIPISIAALTQKSVEQAAEIANGWVPIFFYPERAQDAWGDALDAGLAKRDPNLGPLDVVAQMPLYIGDHADRALDGVRQNLALYVGGMGAKGANFYSDLAIRYGFEDAALTVQELYLTGRKDEAAAAIPEELVVGASLIGTESHVRSRIAALLEAGVTTIGVSSLAPTPESRIEQVGAIRAMLAG